MRRAANTINDSRSPKPSIRSPAPIGISKILAFLEFAADLKRYGAGIDRARDGAPDWTARALKGAAKSAR